MANFALVCPPLPGHLNPATALGRALIRHGHSATYFHLPGIESSIRKTGVSFRPVGTPGSELLAARIQKMAELRGLRSLRFAVACSRECSAILCESLPLALKESAIDLVIVDQNEPAGATVAQHLELPFINICPSLPLNREPEIPPPFVPWDHRTERWARLRNRLGYRLTDRLIAPINATLNRYREAWGLPCLRAPDDSFSPFAQLCQMTADFDFPRRTLPDSFHYLGPFCDGGEAEIAFPYERLNGKPLIYASLGTLQDSNSGYFRFIAEACADFNVQLVMATGGARRMTDLPGAPVVVDYAPQLSLLSRASLAITHAGLNTVMQSLACGVPMVALPITHDQPGIAARVKRSGAGEVIPMARVTARSLRAAVQRVLAGPDYRLAAAKLKQSIELAGGVERAASIVESVLSRTHTAARLRDDALRNR